MDPGLMGLQEMGFLHLSGSGGELVAWSNGGAIFAVPQQAAGN